MSVMVLFAANTFKFSQVLQTAIDITGPNQSPVTGYSVEYAGFFALYVLVGALMTMNLFVAFIIDGFNPVMCVFRIHCTLLALTRHCAATRFQPTPAH